MAGYNQFDRRLETLIVETRTIWGAELPALSESDQKRIAQLLHQNPGQAARLNYERTHTGFIREITVTAADLERLEATHAG